MIKDIVLALEVGSARDAARDYAISVSAAFDRFAIAVILLGMFSAVGAAAERPSLAQQGQALVVKMCASCHATGKDDLSPHLAAPPFRNLDRRTDLDSFADRLRRGLMSGHQDMPTFRFSRDDAYAVSAYVRSIQAP